MSLDAHMNELVTLVKADGRRYPDIRSRVGGTVIFMLDVTLPVEEGDHIERILPNTLIETFVVEERGFHNKQGSFPAHYQSKVRKLSSLRPEKQQGKTVIRVRGANARVNINSTDNSTNTVGFSDVELFESITKLVETKIHDSESRRLLLESLDGMRQARAMGKKRGFVQYYQQFIASAANHMTIFAPFLPALSERLTR
jgi:hypothetical protein